MKKIVIKSLSILLLTGSIASPVFAQNQPILYVEAADMASGTESVQTACKDKAAGQLQDWEQCAVDFAHINSPKWNEHRRVTIKQNGLTFSIELPYNSSWKMGEKTVRPYTIDNLTANQSQHPNALVFGPVNVGCYGIQDGVCNIDRPYAMNIWKKTINSYIAEQKKVDSTI